jgi:hypothetical protein
MNDSVSEAMNELRKFAADFKPDEVLAASQSKRWLIL